MKKTKQDRNKDMERDKRSARRKKTVLRKKHHGFCRKRDDNRHDTFGGTIGFLRARSEVIDLTEVTEPVAADPFYQPENVGTVTFQGPVVQKVVPASTRHTGRSTPWDGMAATLPWGVPGSPRTSACI